LEARSNESGMSGEIIRIQRLCSGVAEEVKAGQVSPREPNPGHGCVIAQFTVPISAIVVVKKSL
jgi:hypothetical protein